MTESLTWNCGRRVFDLSRPLIMGILNVTPDSFSDGGEHDGFEAAVVWGKKLVSEGADIVDVGGESTRPGAAPVSEAEELRRVIPVVKALASEGIAVSVDTSRAAVMQAAFEAGAVILNDVRGFELPGAAETAAKTSAGLIVMHGWEAAEKDREKTARIGITRSVAEYLRTRQQVLEALGADSSRICWDPGFGFGKTDSENFRLLSDTALFVQEGQPFLMALSRKRSIGAATGQTQASERVSGSVAGALIAVERGAHMVRVHDAAQTRQALDVLAAVRKEEH